MKISVRTTHYTNDNSPQLRGYATVKFDDSYVLESVKIMEGKTVMRFLLRCRH